ncbi:MAG: diacylglycerol/lipid kinase family protein [Roseiflexaceae bacterium]
MTENTYVSGRSRSGIRGPVVLVVNHHAGQAASAVAPAQSLAAAGVTVGEQILVSDLDDDHPLGAEWRARGYQAIVAAGGDGTIGTIATQIAGSGLPLGILPLGTSNDTARALGIPLDLDAASAVIAQGIPTPIDAGDVVSLPKGGSLPLTQAAVPRDGKVFLHVLTLGLNVAFARLATDVAQRQRWGKLTYAAAAIAALTQFEPVPITVHFSGSDGTHAVAASESVTCQALQLAIINLPLFGGPLKLHLPGAAAGNGLLDLVIIEALEPPQLRTLVEGLLAAISRLAERGGAAAAEPVSAAPTTDSDEALGFALPGVRRYTIRSAVIETPKAVDVTLDGEVRAQTPVLVRMAPEPLRVLLASESRAALGMSAGVSVVS